MQQILPFDGAPFIVREGSRHRVKIQVSNPGYNENLSDSVKETCYRTRTVTTISGVLEFFEEWVKEIYYTADYNKVVSWIEKQKAKKGQVSNSNGHLLFFETRMAISCSLKLDVHSCSLKLDVHSCSLKPTPGKFFF